MQGFCNGFETTSTGGTQTTYYVGNVEIIKNGTSTETRRYLAGLAIDYVRSSGADETRYTFADHLGSVDVIASSTSSLIEMASFDIHGSRRDPYTWQGTASPLVSTTHGFTGQEHVDAMEFIHFNGRIYDPALGRMLQADPLTGPGNQSLNRYSYVVNNPLSLTDPSGYSWMHNLDRISGWITFGPFFPSVRNDYYAALANPYVRTAGAIVAAYFTFGGASALLADAGWSSAAAAAGASAAAGFASGAIQSGTFEGGLYGAFSAELFFGIGSAFNGASWAHAGGTIGPTDLNAVGFTAKVLAHGIAGGALSSLQGGKFGDGFIGAGVSEALSPAVSSLHNEAGRVTVAALIGGTASKLSGGKFTNGAYSAAFGQLFNDEAHIQHSGSVANTLKRIENAFLRHFGDEDTLVIGEAMNDRVIPYAQQHGYDWYAPTPGLSFDDALQENTDFIIEKMNQGYTIVDIGPQAGRENWPLPTSPFYMTVSVRPPHLPR